jgi:hypothetical protein
MKRDKNDTWKKTYIRSERSNNVYQTQSEIFKTRVSQLDGYENSTSPFLNNLTVYRIPFQVRTRNRLLDLL